MEDRIPAKVVGAEINITVLYLFDLVLIAAAPPGQIQICMIAFRNTHSLEGGAFQPAPFCLHIQHLHLRIGIHHFAPWRINRPAIQIYITAFAACIVGQFVSVPEGSSLRDHRHSVADNTYIRVGIMLIVQRQKSFPEEVYPRFNLYPDIPASVLQGGFQSLGDAVELLLVRNSYLINVTATEFNFSGRHLDLFQRIINMAQRFPSVA